MKKTNGLLYGLALAKFMLPFLLQSPYYQPHRDEFLYLAEANHPAWGFMEVPPLLSVFAMITNAFGGSMFWIKFWPSLFGALTFIVTGKVIESLGGKSFALVVAFLGFVTAAYVRVHYLFQPNFLEIFFWTMIAFSCIRYVQTKRNRFLYLLGISVGLGLMSKYSVAFFTVSVAIGLLLTKERSIYTNKHLYYAMLVALVICLPNIFWQYNHHYPLLYHMELLKEEQLQYINPSSFLIGQLMMNLPCVFIWLAGLLFTACTKEGRPYRFIAWTYASVIIILATLHGKDYYALGAYPILFAFGAYYLEKITENGFVAWRVAIIAIPSYLGWISATLLLPFKSPETLAAYYEKKNMKRFGVLRWEDLKDHPLPQDFADMIGWKEVSEKVANVYHSLSKEEQAATMIYSGQYAFAGSVNYYGKKLNLPEVYSHNASFLLWMPQQYHYRNIILIQHDIPSPSNPIDSKFKEVIVKDSLDMPLAREHGVKIILLRDGTQEANDLITQKIAAERSRFMR